MILRRRHGFVAFARWDKGGPADDVVVVADFLHEPQDGYVWRITHASDTPH